MEKPKILYVSQEIKPYLPDSPVGLISRNLPQGIMDCGKDIRTFMPRFGSVNERRNQLHEVIRLSGQNICIDDTDHPLLIKVASIQAARMQIYFIDNDDFFTRKGVIADPNSGVLFDDNDERAIFFARGVLETTKKLRWEPDIIHLQGWFTMMICVFRRFLVHDDPFFANSRIIVSLYADQWDGSWENVDRKLWVEGMNLDELNNLGVHDYVSLMKMAIDLSDGVVVSQQGVLPELIDYAKQSGKPFCDFPGDDNYVAAYNDFYDKVLNA